MARRSLRRGTAAPPTREEVLRVMGRPGFPPSSLREMLRRLKVDKHHRNAFKRLMRELLSEGKVIHVGSTRYALAGSESTSDPEVVTGTVQRHPDGFGFVVPDSGRADLYVHPRNLDAVFHGDRVEARVLRRGGRGRDEGMILRVVEPAARRVMGILRHGDGEVTVEAYDRGYPSGIVVAREDSARARDGEVVGVEVLDPPSRRYPARGRVVEVLGSPEEPGMDIRTVVRKYGLREEFPEEALREAERAPDPVPQEEMARREDFRDRSIVTIDGETAQDFDDAVSVERWPGGYRLGVHIADVGHYVPEGSALDQEARERGTSVYFPGTAIPMLPPRLSSGLCSLRSGEDRLTVSVLLEIDGRGTVKPLRFVEGVIRSVERMTYTDVARILEERDPEALRRYAPLIGSFEIMAELATVLNRKRRERGTIDFDLPEPEILLDLQGGTRGIVPLRRNVAHRIIEEFMLAANEAVAEFLHSRRVPSLYRVHERPDPQRVAQLNELLAAFSVRLPEPYDALEPSHFQAVLDGLEGRPEFRFLSRAMLRAMKLARYSEAKALHFGLGTSTYTHFTSPIRRYPDLVVHRRLKEVLRNGSLSPDRREALRQTLPGIAASSSRSERNADDAEWEVVEWKKLAYLAGRIGECFEGFVSSVTPFGVFVEIPDLFVEGLVHVSALPEDRYQFVERKQILKGTRTGRVYRLGEPLAVRLDRVD